MVEIKILDNSASATPTSLAAPFSEDQSSAAPQNLAIELEAGGSAFFRIPTVRDARIVEKASKTKLTLTDFCRELGKVCLISWGDSQPPSDDDIDVIDDQSIVRLFLEQLAGAPDENLDDEALVDRFMGREKESGDLFKVLADKSHCVTLDVGVITLRRLTRSDARRIESLDNSKTNFVGGDVIIACSLCTKWWSGDREIMPADFDPVPLSQFRRVTAAVNAFLRRVSNPK